METAVIIVADIGLSDPRVRVDGRIDEQASRVAFAMAETILEVFGYAALDKLIAARLIR